MTTTAADDVRTDTPEQAEFRTKVRAWLTENIEPRREANLWSVNFHTDDADAQAEFESQRALQQKLYAAGLTAFTYPKQYGGQGGPPWMESIYREEAGRFETNVGFLAATQAMLGPTLMKYGTEEQKAEYLPKLLSGDWVFCQLFSEPGAGSDLAGLATKAVRDGDEFVLTGQKVWNSAAQWCDHGFILVRTDPDAPKHRGITFLLIEMDSPGIEVRPLVQPTGAKHFNEVFLSEVRVPVANVLGEINGGWAPARTVMSNESALIGGGSRGLSVADKLRLLATQNGLNNDPIIRQGLATAVTRERVLGWMGEQIMAAVRRREVPPMDPSILKLFVAMNRVQTGNLAMQLGGMNSIAGDSDITQWMQAEVLSRYTVSIGGGTDEVQRNNLAERALGLPKEPRNDHEIPWKDVPRS